MSFGLKVWLVIWSLVTVLMMFQSLDTNIYKIFSYEQMWNNLFIFTPASCVLLVSIFFQILKSYLKNILIPACVAITTYFIVLMVSLPYSFYACLLAGLVVAPVGLFHYKLSVTFFGDIEY